MDEEMTYAQQVVADNTWENCSDRELDFCEFCNSETEHYEVSGSTVWDRYDYSVCCKCGKTDNEIACYFWAKNRGGVKL